ncbi:hypothetical protein QGN23_02330 [Chryseobacterium gotjawalense]|uniref:Uncharacterized protein n=1 Tax=Chryseobacterium gotjawalense TaxID=3042315 RepID=A0ABY8RDS6_9FLAO|nr:hypothetical protein [Chryseobacterium sp. wdc7]WHF52123.1 hypothetical protein QGN23_02330 [Chryseobacterium sp. wdc7]
MEKNRTFEFAFSNKRLFTNLVLGILWLGIGISYFFEQDDKLRYKPYVVSVLGILYISLFLFEFKQKYFEITKDKIKIKSIPSKEINLNEVTEVKYYADDYTFKTPIKSLKIVKSQINKKQLPEFENFFNNLNSELKKNAV